MGVGHDLCKNPIDFEVIRSKVKVTVTLKTRTSVCTSVHSLVVHVCINCIKYIGSYICNRTSRELNNIISGSVKILFQCTQVTDSFLSLGEGAETNIF